jgi:hypothetical protein
MSRPGFDRDATKVIKSNRISGARRKPADRDAGRATRDPNPLRKVRQIRNSGYVSSDKITLNQTSRRSRLDPYSFEEVTRDEVARRWRRSTNRCPGSGIEDDSECIKQRVCAGNVGADEVPLHQGV